MDVENNIDDKLIANQMSQYNFTIQRCLKVLKQKETDLDALICHEEKERVSLQEEIEKMTRQLTALDKRKSKRILLKENYENLINAIEDDYRRIVTLSESLSKTAEKHCLELLNESSVELKFSNIDNNVLLNITKRSDSKSRGDNVLNTSDTASNCGNEIFESSESMDQDDSEIKICKHPATCKSSNSKSSTRNSKIEMNHQASGSNQILFIKTYKRRKSNSVPGDCIRNNSPVWSTFY